MTTYSIRCRNGACRHRRVSNIHPFEYKLVPACQACGARCEWRIEARGYHKRHLCRCDGPLGRNAMPYPHRTTHPMCDQHPAGFYNQAKRAGIDDADIPIEYWPAPDLLTAHVGGGQT